jgi:exopolysaccharide biosynthesis polyprenyl glycosylphosphotransferase
VRAAGHHMSARHPYGEDRGFVRAPMNDSVMSPAIGLPAVVGADGAASLPLVAPVPVAAGDRHDAAGIQAAGRRALQWLLEGRGWDIARPAVDLLAAGGATVIALGGVGATANVSALRAPLLALPLCVVALLYLRGLYRSRLRALFLDYVLPVGGAVSVAAMSVVALGLLINGHAPSASHSLRAWGLTLAAVGIGRMILSLAQRIARSRGLIGSPVLILGAGVVGSQMAQRLENHPEYGLRPVGFLDDDPRSPADGGGEVVPVVGTVEELDEIVARTGVRHLIVAFSSVTDSRVAPLIQSCQELGIEVSVVPRMFDMINNRVSYETVGGLPLLSFSTVSPTSAQFAFKHAFDRIAAALLLIALAPVMACVAVAVRLSSPGPILFRQRRVGRDGTLFDLFKFRSMRLPAARGEDAQAAGEAVPWRGEDDGAEATMLGARESRTANAPEDALAGSPAEHTVHWLGRDIAPGGVEGEDRRTLVGQLIRRTALDELPQLINVLRGEMSLVGPRPERPEFVELFRQEVSRYGDRHRVKSGITGWAQVHGLRGKTSLAERVEWDNYYIAHWSLGLDLKILLLTALALFHGSE